MAISSISNVSCISSKLSPSATSFKQHPSKSSQCFQALRLGSSAVLDSSIRQYLAEAVIVSSGKTGESPATTVVCSTNGHASNGHALGGTGTTIVFVSAEVAPWSKTGGLGDVVGGLPPALAARNNRVMSISPRYDQYRDAWDTEKIIEVKVADKMERVRFFHARKRGVDRVFVDHPLFLAKVWGKTGSKIYGPITGEDYIDNQLRFSLLCQAALQAPLVLSMDSNEVYSGLYGEDVIFVANDWHTALVPCYLKAYYKPRGIYKNAKVAFCIHNVAYQGRFPFQDFSLLNLPASFKSSFDFTDGYDKPVKGRKINWMKAGILESDKVLTVSPNYALELVSGIQRGVELDSIVRKTGIMGIVNGMDVQEWDPSSDKYLEVNYDATTVLDAKPVIKEALQAEVGLPVNPDVPVIGVIGRLEEQKGIDILYEALEEILKLNVQLIILGIGKKVLEKKLEDLEVRFPDKARGIVQFNVPLAHKITAGSDFIAVPSRFEPCGLIQLYAMRNGTIPIVVRTGGLADTVKEGVTGFLTEKAFNVKCEEVDPADVQSLVTTVKKAVKSYGTPKFAKMIKDCMVQDLSWKEPARKWESVLQSLQVDGSKSRVERDDPALKAVECVATA